jgi:hypothetical protein
MSRGRGGGHGGQSGHAPATATIATRPCFSSAQRNWYRDSSFLEKPRGSNSLLPERERGASLQ